MKTILYIHGLGSGLNSNTLIHLKRFFKEYNVIGIEVNENPFESVTKIQNYINKNKIDIVIGCSLGGFYLAYIKNVKYRFLINPGFKINEILKERIGYGTYDFFCDRDDKRTSYVINDSVIDNFNTFINDNNIVIGDNSFILFSTIDELIGSELQLQNIQIGYNNKFNLIFSNKFGHRINSQTCKIIKSEYEKCIK